MNSNMVPIDGALLAMVEHQLRFLVRQVNEQDDLWARDAISDEQHGFAFDTMLGCASSMIAVAVAQYVMAPFLSDEDAGDDCGGPDVCADCQAAQESELEARRTQAQEGQGDE